MGKTKKRTPETGYQVRVSENALQNVREITGYTALLQKQPLNGVKVADAIEEAI